MYHLWSRNKNPNIDRQFVTDETGRAFRHTPNSRARFLLLQIIGKFLLFFSAFSGSTVRLPIILLKAEILLNFIQFVVMQRRQTERNWSVQRKIRKRYLKRGKLQNKSRCFTDSNEYKSNGESIYLNSVLACLYLYFKKIHFLTILSELFLPR